MRTLFLLTLFSARLFAAVAFVNGDNGTCFGSSGTSVTCSLTVTAGNTLLAQGGKNVSGPTITGFGDGINTYTQIGTITSGGQTAIGYCVASIATTTTITVTMTLSSTGGAWNIQLAQFSGM